MAIYNFDEYREDDLLFRTGFYDQGESQVKGHWDKDYYEGESPTGAQMLIDALLKMTGYGSGGLGKHILKGRQGSWLQSLLQEAMSSGIDPTQVTPEMMNIQTKYILEKLGTANKGY